MANCKYCTEYHLNSHERIDDCCLGPNDCRKEHFICNEDRKPKNAENNKKKDKE